MQRQLTCKLWHTSPLNTSHWPKQTTFEMTKFKVGWEIHILQASKKKRTGIFIKYPNPAQPTNQPINQTQQNTKVWAWSFFSKSWVPSGSWYNVQRWEGAGRDSKGSGLIRGQLCWWIHSWTFSFLKGVKTGRWILTGKWFKRVMPLKGRSTLASLKQPASSPLGGRHSVLPHAPCHDVLSYYTWTQKHWSHLEMV